MNTELLQIELAVLRRCELRFGLSAKRVTTQLLEDAERPLPDLFPLKPEWKSFNWPISGEVDFRDYWRQMSRSENR